MSLVAKSVRGVQKMDATGEKMKKVSVKENKVASTIFGKNANITKGVNKIAKDDDKKKSLKEKLKEMIRQELKEAINGSAEVYEDFNEWLVALSNEYSKGGGISSELRELGIDASTSTPDELIAAIKEKAGPGRNYYLSFSVDNGEIRAGHSFKTYGKWDTSTDSGFVEPTSPPLNVYPPGSWMD